MAVQTSAGHAFASPQIVTLYPRVEEKCEKVKVAAVVDAREEEQAVAAQNLKELEEKLTAEHALAIEQLRVSDS